MCLNLSVPWGSLNDVVLVIGDQIGHFERGKTSAFSILSLLTNIRSSNVLVQNSANEIGFFKRRKTR